MATTFEDLLSGLRTPYVQRRASGHALQTQGVSRRGLESHGYPCQFYHKTIHGVFRDRVVPYVRGGASELQVSAHRGALVSLGAHIVRLHPPWAKLKP